MIPNNNNNNKRDERIKLLDIWEAEKIAPKKEKRKSEKVDLIR